jgi:flagellar motor switch protein FliN/FliY
MAPKKAKTPDLDFPGDAGAGELDGAIDDLRGVLKADEEGGLPDLGGDFGADFPSADGTAAFGGDFGLDDAGSSAEFGGDFGDSGFGGSEFGTDMGGGMVAEPGSAMHANLDLIMDIPIDVQIILGTSRMQVQSLMNLTEGATIALDRKIGEPVDLMVNGRLIGRGEITIMENDESRFGIRLIEIASSRKK